MRKFVMAVIFLGFLALALPAGAADISPDLWAGVAIFAAGQPVSVDASISQRIGSLKAAEFSADAIFLATPGGQSSLAGALCVKAKTGGNVKAGLGYAPGRNTTKLSSANVFVNLQYVKATAGPASLGFTPADPPVRELSVGLIQDSRIGAQYTWRW